MAKNWIFENYKFRIKSERHSKLIQKLLFKLGYDWGDNDKKMAFSYQFTDADFLFTDSNGQIAYENYDSYFFDNDSSMEKTFEFLSKLLNNGKGYTIYGKIIN